jgi:Ser/Thr protein kinase RdoA (MazF antagonist)
VTAARALASTALSAWDLPDPRFTKLPKGWNATFRVEAGARYVLRVARPDGPTPAQVRAEATWLAALRRDTDLVVPEPVRTRDGDLVTTVDGRACVLYRWIDGRFLDAGLTPAHLHAVGILTARLQEHGASMPPLDRPRVDRLFCDDPVGLVAGLTSPAYGEVVAGVLDRYAAAASTSDSGFLHADLHQENVLFTGGRVGAIDFDDCGYGPYAYDLAVTISELWHLPRAAELRAALLEGYGTLRPVPAAAVLDDLVAFRYLQLKLYATTHRDEPMFRADWHDDLVGTLDHLRR